LSGPHQTGKRPRVAVVGGGLAGLSTACALAGAGYPVRLLERRPYVGGRASSYEHPGTGEVVDNCQHILLGCCTNLIHLYRQLGVEDRIGWFDRITFLEPGGRRSVLEPCGLPAPFHASPAFLRAPALSLADKLAIARAMPAFLRGVPPDSQENFAGWLKRHGQTRRAIGRFWNPVLISALNDELDRVSVHYAGMVFRMAFLQSAQGGAMGIPRIPLSQLYGYALDYITQRGGTVSLRTGIDSLSYHPATGEWRLQSATELIAADCVVLALPFEGMQKLLPSLPDDAARERLAAQLARFEHSPITGIHLWFDRSITDLPHAVLLDATIQWMYNKTLLQPEVRGSFEGSYLELVVSASRSLVAKSRQEVIGLAVEELAQFFPEVRRAQLLKAAVVKEVRATFTVTPGLDAVRPEAVSGWPGIYLAGDWTATGWPSTMEGAVRSGFLAAESIAKAAGESQRFLQPDLPPQGLMRLFA
jgi:squalene-associated FAD-dependent desaturase